MATIDNKEFERWVSESIDSLPEKYLSAMRNVAFIIEDNPTEEQRAKLRLSNHQTLFGLYEGIPLTARGMNYNLVLPDKITIFKHPLESISDSPEVIRARVRRTVWHEVAHHFGLGHGRIEELQNKP